MRICFLIRSLGIGGAERQLSLLATGLHHRGHDVTVCVTYAGGAMAAELEARGVPVVALQKRSRWDLTGVVASLRRMVRERAPDVLHGYMPTSNLLTLLAAGAGGPAVVWGVRASHLDWGAYDWMARASFEATRRFASRADLVIANSEAGRRFHVAQGYPAERTIVVPNGVDTARHCRDEPGRVRQRAAWGVPDGAPLVGLVGRLDPMKDHATFLRACARVAAARPDARFVCVGDGPAPFSAALRALAGDLGIAAQTIWVEPRTEVTAMYSALDVHVSASCFGEGFSNAIAEAMACEVPSVTTDVGDAATVVGPTGRVVPPREPALLADAVLALLATDLPALGRDARARVVREFGVDQLVSRTLAALEPVVAGRARRTA